MAATKFVRRSSTLIPRQVPTDLSTGQGGPLSLANAKVATNVAATPTISFRILASSVSYAVAAD